MAEVATVADMCHHADELVHGFLLWEFLLGLVLGWDVVGFEFDFEGERDQPEQLCDTFAGLVIFEPPEMDWHEIR